MYTTHYWTDFFISKYLFTKLLKLKKNLKDHKLLIKDEKKTEKKILIKS